MKKKYIKITVFLSILCAVWVHIVLFTDVGHRLQSSIIESDTSSHAQAHLVADDGILTLRLNVTADNVTGVSGKIFFDDESLVLSNPISLIGGDIAEMESEFSREFALTLPTEIQTTKGDTIMQWDITTLLPESNTINLTDVTLQMTDGDVRLTTEGTGEF